MAGVECLLIRDHSGCHGNTAEDRLLVQRQRRLVRLVSGDTKTAVLPWRCDLRARHCSTKRTRSRGSLRCAKASPARQSPRERLAASEENREVRERSSPQSSALPALYACPPSSTELLPVCVDPVRGVESIRISPLLLGEKAVDSAGQERPRIVAQLEVIHAKSLLCRSS